jgi:hypothetical protein
MARLREHYTKTVLPALMQEFGYKNIMAVPKIEKISLNIGLGEATGNPKLMDGAVNELGQIAGQRPVICKATKSIAAFNNLKRLCEEHLPGRYKIEVIDLVQNPKLARDDQIVAIPTLVRKLPDPIRRIIGDLSNTERTLVGLQLRPSQP